MIYQTEGIVLKSFPYSDHQLIASVLTPDFGRKDFIVPGAYSKSGKIGKHIYFQPLSHIEFTFYDKPGRGLQKITDVRYRHLYSEWHSHPVKSLYCFLTAEILSLTLPSEMPNEELYLKIKTFLFLFDSAPHSFYNLFIFFIFHLTRDLGFFPQCEEPVAGCEASFDLKSGTIIYIRSGFYSWHRHFAELYHMNDYRQCIDLNVPKEERMPVLKTLLQYYSIHVPGFRELNSLAVFEEIFR